jgi:hypothetical protein
LACSILVIIEKTPIARINDYLMTLKNRSRKEDAAAFTVEASGQKDIAPKLQRSAARGQRPELSGQ